MKNLTFTLIAIFAFSFSQLSAEIHYTKFDHGFIVGLNENIVIDIDNNGDNDFYINAHQDELGFSPIFGAGCFAGTGMQTAFSAHELSILEKETLLNFSTQPYFIEGDRASIATADGDIADGWVEGEDHFIGFMIWSTGNFGWIKVSFDTEQQVLIIKEWAYNDSGQTGVFIGDTGEPTVQEIPVSVYDLSDEISQVELSPNPAVSQALLKFIYKSKESLQVVVLSSTGQEVYHEQLSNLSFNNTVIIPTANLANGLYFVQLKTKEGVRVEKLMKQ